mmetsp:Transcript_17469/g.40020  ORF Transcript_17469/g.40020 Transcript_17469/m.40020 type:complete len:86 (+) Transcript_17469:32-289(+)
MGKLRSLSSNNQQGSYSQDFKGGMGRDECVEAVKIVRRGRKRCRQASVRSEDAEVKAEEVQQKGGWASSSTDDISLSLRERHEAP